MLTAAAWLAALVAYPVASWLTRLVLMVVTLPLAGPVRDARSVGLLRGIRLLGAAITGAGGFAAAAWISASLGGHAWSLLAAVLVVLVAIAHGRGLRRLAGGPQLREELFAFAGEEAGLIAVAAYRLVP